MQTYKQYLASSRNALVTFIFALSVAILFFASSLSAKVLSKSPSGFQLSISTPIEKPVEDVYQQFLAVGDWWEDDHTWFGDSSKMSIDPRVNGCFCEIDADKQALHMTLSYVEPNKEIRMLGGLGPLQMMAVHGAMSWQFKRIENGTELVLTYTVTGFDGMELDKITDIVDQVQQTQINNLKALLEPTPNNLNK